MTFPRAQLALVVAMASDKDHLAFAREFLTGMAPVISLCLLYLISVEVGYIRQM